MSMPVVPSGHPAPLCCHASSEEYKDFVYGYTQNRDHRRLLLQYQARFMQRYPDLRNWFSAPLAERVGRLHGEDISHLSYQESYQARRYLLFLAIRGYARFDWEWLLALGYLSLGTLLDHMHLETGVNELFEEAQSLGYIGRSTTDAISWGVSRIFLHTAQFTVNTIQETDLDALSQAVFLFKERSDVSLFYGSDERYGEAIKCYRRFLHTLRIVLYHRGQVSTEPRVRRPPVQRVVLKPRMEAVIARYLTARRLTDRPATVSKIDEALRCLITWLAQTYPELETFAEVTRDHMLQFAEALNTMPTASTQRPYAENTRVRMLSCLSVFFQDVTKWQWEDVPVRLLLQHGDLPKRSQRIPRYIPDEELAPLMAAIRSLECPYQRTALLVARWSGARRGEIRRLSVDCLDQYLDGTPRLHIPVGKTKRERMIPLNKEAAEAIRSLQQQRKGERGFRDEQTGLVTRYLFVNRGKLLSVEYLFESPLRTVCQATGQVTADDKPTVTAHRFRHTVGTQLTNRGAKLRTVMSVLGHQSAQMALIYAQISDKEVLKDYQSVLGPGATIAGPAAESLRSGELGAAAVDWLKTNYLKTELELGRCLRLPQEGPCECDLYLTCAKFVTTPQYAPRLRRRRKIELELIEDAITHGWQREVERHQCTVRRIELLLTDLKEPIDGPEATD